jgi:hypothetical protein
MLCHATTYLPYRLNVVNSGYVNPVLNVVVRNVRPASIEDASEDAVFACLSTELVLAGLLGGCLASMHMGRILACLRYGSSFLCLVWDGGCMPR